MAMHFIQKHILDSLRTAPAQHYAELKTPEIESGHFRYHLQRLLREGYVVQLERGLYSLSTKGQGYVDTLSAHKFTPEAMPKVITYTLLRNGEMLLLLKKPKQPYMDLLNMVGGKVHYGETTVEASIREVSEKTGLTMTNPKLAGVFEIQISSADQLLSHVIAYTYVADLSEVPADSSNLISADVESIETIQNMAPDFLPIYRLISRGDTVVTADLQLEL